MLKVKTVFMLFTLAMLPTPSIAKSVILSPGSTTAVITGINTPENTIEFTSNGESYVIDDLWADTPEGVKLIKYLEDLIKSAQRVDIDFAIVQPNENDKYNYKIALFIGHYGSPTMPNSNKVYYSFDKNKSFLKIDPLSDARFVIISDHIRSEVGKAIKDIETVNKLQEQEKTIEANKSVLKQPKVFPVPEFKFPYDIPSKCVLQAVLYDLIGIESPVEWGVVRFKDIKITNNYTRKFNDETVYIIDLAVLIDTFSLDLNTNILDNTTQQQNRSVQGEIAFIKRGAKWFTFNEFAKRWVELPSG